MAAVIVVGSFNLDYVWRTERFPTPGETRRALGFSRSTGGKGANQAVACSRQGVATCFIAAIGDDDISAHARRLAKEEHLDARWQVNAGSASGNACVLVDATGQNQILVDLAANERLDAMHVEAQAPAFTQARVVLTQLETRIEPVRAALRLAQQHGALGLLNPAPVHADVDDALIAGCDVLIPNETEFAMLLQRLAGIRVEVDTLAALGDADLATLASRLPTRTVVITLGAAGCFVAHRDAPRLGDVLPFYRVPANKVNAIDTTGAGDTFCGALAATLANLHSPPFREAIVHASRCAALATERRGAATAAPTWREVIDRFQQKQ